MTELSLAIQLQKFRETLVASHGEFQAALPSQIPVERFARTIVTAVQMEPKLLAADRRSLVAACMKAAQDGLLLDGREAGLSLYNDRASNCQTVAYMPMVNGILKKIRQSGEISSIRAHVVYEGDEFDFELGDDESIFHKPNLAEQGQPIAAYAIAKFKDGDIQREVMSFTEIEKIRAKATGIGKACWASSWGEMAKKTVIRRLSKRLPTSNDLGADRDTIDTVVPASVEEMTPPSLQPAITVEDLNHQIAAAQESPTTEPEPTPEPEPQAPNSEAPPSFPNLDTSSPNLGPSTLTLEPTSSPEQPAPATEPGTVQRLPQGRTTVAADPQPAPAPAPAAPATGRRSAAAAPVRRPATAATPAAEAPIPGLD
jgi:phage RecT family recombinase